MGQFIMLWRPEWAYVPLNLFCSSFLFLSFTQCMIVMAFERLFGLSEDQMKILES